MQPLTWQLTNHNSNTQQRNYVDEEHENMNMSSNHGKTTQMHAPQLFAVTKQSAEVVVRLQIEHKN